MIERIKILVNPISYPLRYISIFFLVAAAFLLLQSISQAHVQSSKDQTKIGMDQKLGQYVSLDLTFKDENGQTVSLKQLIHKPTILALVYLHCPNVCSLLLQNLAEVLNNLPAEPGKEYFVLAVSFDEMEKPALALQRKKIYLKMIQRPFPEDAWRFLTGDKTNIRELTDAVGFQWCVTSLSPSFLWGTKQEGRNHSEGTVPERKDIF